MPYRLSLLFILAALFGVARCGAADEPAPPLLRQVVNAIAAGNAAPVLGSMEPPLAALLTPEAVTSVKAGFFDPFGAVKEVVVTSRKESDTGTVIDFTVRMAKGETNGIFAVNKAGKVAGLRFLPAKPTERFASYVTKTEARLPFDGEWFAFWGGKDPKKNYHAVSRSQRYAYDLLIVRNGVSHKGAGKKNEDYFCFGKPVLAPVAGTVVSVTDGVAENVPGQMNPGQLVGNSVVIDDGHGEYALLAHMQPHRLKVKVGDKVALGQPLGYCGNTGNSSEPHIHFHMMTGPDINNADGLPVTFRRFLQNGKPIAAGVADGKVRLENQ